MEDPDPVLEELTRDWPRRLRSALRVSLAYDPKLNKHIFRIVLQAKVTVSVDEGFLAECDDPRSEMKTTLASGLQAALGEARGLGSCAAQARGRKTE